jgi:hypothetical protein
MLGDYFMKLDGSSYPSSGGFFVKNEFEILYDHKWVTDVLKMVKIRWRG